MTKCDEIGEVTLVELAIARSSSSEDHGKAVTAEVGRKRKAVAGELDCSSASQTRSRRSLVVKLDNSNFGKEESSSNDPCASCCSSNGSTELDKEISKFVDLEEERLDLSSRSTYEYGSWRERRESTPSSEIQGESGELDSTRRPASEINSRRRSVNKKMPSSAEIDEFFSAAEKDLQRQYAEKYNFDFVKEQPLEGRYNWVRVENHERKMYTRL